ncbi:MAG: response regulator [Deltaproteobacteria bacterium]|nr:response regulator [Deltaproteobacteria bacterium]
MLVTGEKSGKVNRILVADNQSTVLCNAVSGLSDSKCTVYTAQTCDEVKNYVLGQTFAHFFIDVELDGRNQCGIDLVRWLKKQDIQTPVHMLSCSDSTDLLLACLLAGANDYIWKGGMKPNPLLQMKRVTKEFSLWKCRLQRGIMCYWAYSIFRTRGLCNTQIDLLARYTELGFPDIYELSDIMKVSENALVKRFTRIERTLRLKNRAALIQLLTIASGYMQTV